MPGPPSSSRRARSKWRARSPTPPSRTCGPGHQRLRRRQLLPLRVDPCRRFRRRKPERKRGRQCSCGPDNSSFHRSRRPPKQDRWSSQSAKRMLTAPLFDRDAARSDGRATGTDPRSGKPVAIDVVDICRFSDGKLVEHWGCTGSLCLAASNRCASPAVKVNLSRHRNFREREELPGPRDRTH